MVGWASCTLCGVGETIGRARELAAVDAALALGRSHVSALVLEGNPGIGKTTIWSSGVERARSGGASVLSARSAPIETSLSFSVLTDLLSTIEPSSFDRLPGPQRRALDVALLRASPSSTPLDARAIAAGLLSIVRDRATVGPVAIAVDDVQWVDRASARALDYVIRRLRAEPVTVLLSRRTDATTTRPHLLDALPADTPCIEVGPLDASSLARLVRPHLGDRFSPPLLARIARATNGNPLHAIAVARLLAQGGAPSAHVPLPIPEDVRASVRAGIGGLPRSTRTLLGRLSLQSRPTVISSELRVLDAAEEAGVVTVAADGLVQFSHPLMAAAIVHGLSSDRRRRIHASLADTAPTAEERAMHLARSTIDPDERVAALLDEAGSDAHVRGAVDVAAELAEHALRLTPAVPPTRLAYRRLTAAGYAAITGDSERALVLASSVVDTPTTGTTRARALQVVAEATFMSDLERATQLVTDAADHAVDDPALAADLQHQLAGLALTRMQLHVASGHAERGVAAAERCGDHAIVAEADAMRCAIDALAGRRIDHDRLDRAIAWEDLDRDRPFQASASSLVGSVHLWTSAIDDARSVYRRLDRHLVARGRDSDRTWVLAQLAQVEWLAADWPAALRSAEDCIDSADLHGQPIFRGLGLLIRGTLAAEGGRGDAARVDFDELAWIAERTNWSVGIGQVAYGRGRLALLEGDPEAALGHLLPPSDVAASLGVYEWPVAVAVPELVEALVATGNSDEAAARARALSAWGSATDRPWPLGMGARARALVHETRGQLAEAEAAALDALGHHERLSRPMDTARTHEVLGRVMRRSNARRSAREHLVRARSSFVSIGATVAVARVEQELSRTGVRRASADLTSTERQVANLSASGATNATVASQLHMSVRTVETNLARVYRKLGIHSRAELGALMSSPNASAPEG